MTEFLEEKGLNSQERNLSLIKQCASESIHKAQEYNLKQFEQRNQPARFYEDGDYVVIKNVDTTVGTNKKLLPKFKGPYVIHKILPHDRYIVRDIENCQITQLPYDGVIEARNLRLWREAV